MGGVQPSQFDIYFRQDRLDDILHEIIQLKADSINNNSSDQQQLKQQLETTLSLEEWNVISILCRTEKQKLASEQVSHTRARLMTLWADEEAPRQAAASSVLMAMVCFLEATLNTSSSSRNDNNNNNNNHHHSTTTDEAIAISARLSSMAGLVMGDLVQTKALSWASKLATLDPQYAFYEMNQELEQLSPENDPVRTWCASLTMACYCILFLNGKGKEIFRRKVSSSDGKDNNNTQNENENSRLLLRDCSDARAMGFYCVEIALKCKTIGASNAVAEKLWDLLESNERAYSLSSVVYDRYPSPPTVTGFNDLSNAYVGQLHALKEISEIFRAKKEGVIPSDKPTVLLFAGPSGYGKTELGKWIARIQHQNLLAHPDPEAATDNAGSLLVLNMTNYCTDSSLNSLIDPPAGIKGEGGLIKSIAEHPDLVVVADEFEKSTASAVNNLWLPAFERYGKISSAKDPRERVSTNKVTFVLTCNLCDTEILRAAPRYHHASTTEQVKREMREGWIKNIKEQFNKIVGNNALINRITAVIPFVPFTELELQRYVDLQITDFQRDQLQYGREFYYSYAVVEELAKKVKNFHSQSVRDALRGPMLKAVDANESCILVMLKTPHPIRDQFEFEQQQKKQQQQQHSESSSSSSSSAAAATAATTSGNNNNNSSEPDISSLFSVFIGANQIEAIGGEDSKEIAKWAREKKLLQLHKKFIEAAEQQRQHEKEKILQTKKQQQQQEEKEKEQKEKQEKEEEAERERIKAAFEKEEQEKKQQQQQQLEAAAAKQEESEKEETERKRRIEQQQQMNIQQQKEQEAEQQQLQLLTQREREREQEKEKEKQQKLLKQRELEQEAERLRDLRIQNEQQQKQQKQQQQQQQQQQDVEYEQDIIHDTKKNHQQHTNNNNNHNNDYKHDEQKELRLLVQQLRDENLSLKTKLQYLENLVENLQHALALAMMFSFISVFIMSWFVPLKFVFLTIALVLAIGNYFINNFFEILKAAAIATYKFLGPKKCAIIVLFLLLYSGTLGSVYSSGAFSSSSLPPCRQVTSEKEDEPKIMITKQKDQQQEEDAEKETSSSTLNSGVNEENSLVPDF